MQQILNCIDAGSEYCPCYLAEIEECLMCSQLQGKAFCDCRNWKGVCIYQEYVWNRNRMKEGRRTSLCTILEKKVLMDAVMLLKIQVSRTLARELNQPGAYVFMRDVKNPAFFDTPMSVMRANEEEGTIEIAIQIRGVKTKSLQELGTEILIRGPYWNGLLGLKYLKGLSNGKALLVTRGIAQAPALPVARKLILSGNSVDVILDKGRAGINFTEEYFKELGCQVIHKPVLNGKTLTILEETRELIRQYIVEKGINLIYSGGSDKLHEGIGELLAELKSGVYFTCSNDAKFCCGEGVCGSCHTRLNDGSRIKTCKTQISPVEIFGGRE
ncbi:MAG: Oxidoreductase FAD-binding domain protein [Peptococcaceae bacterium]|nr:Oxidoreductase FAD-binding domain protein [Peptococcaceae bacterium]